MLSRPRFYHVIREFQSMWCHTFINYFFEFIRMINLFEISAWAAIMLSFTWKYYSTPPMNRWIEISARHIDLKFFSCNHNLLFFYRNYLRIPGWYLNPFWRSEISALAEIFHVIETKQTFFSGVSLFDRH